jgi:hypothetical protein
MNDMIYLPIDIRTQWESRGGLKVLQAFLRDGMEFMEQYADFSPKANEYLNKRPILKKLLLGDINNAD